MHNGPKPYGAKNHSAINGANSASGAVTAGSAEFTASTFLSPYRLLMILAITVFIGEAAIMYYLDNYFHSSNIATEMLVDASLITILAFIISYIFFYRPSSEMYKVRLESEAAVRQSYSELMESQSALLESETKFRTLFNSSHDAILITHGRSIVDFNEPFLEMLGATVEDLAGKDFTNFIAPEDHKVVAANIAADYDKPYEITGIRKNGERLPIEVHGKTVTIFGEQYRLTSIIDISARKEIEIERERHLKQLETLSNYNRRLLDVAPIGAWIIDYHPILPTDIGIDTSWKYHERLGTRVVTRSVNETMTKMLGFTKQEMEGKSIFDPMFMDEANAEIYMREINARRAGNQGAYELVLKRKSGDHIPVLINAAPTLFDPTGNPTQAIGMMVDLTERKRSEEVLRASEERLRMLIKYAGNAIVITTPQGAITEFNDAAEKIWNMNRDEVVGRDFLLTLIPDSAREYFGRKSRTALQGLEMPAFESPILLKDNTSHTLLWTFSAFGLASGGTGGAGGVIISAQDITKQVETLAELRRSREELQTIINTTTEGFWMVNLERKTIDLNESLCRMLGYSRDEIIGKTPFDFMDEANREKFVEISAKTHERRHRTYPISLLRKDGSLLPVMLSSTTAYDDTSRAIFSFAFVTDISDMVRAQEELRLAKEQAEDATLLKDKFVSLVAHDLRSPFNSIMGLLQLVMADKVFPTPPTHKAIFAQILATGESMLNMIEELLKISRLKTGKIAITPKFFDAYQPVMSAIFNLSHLADDKKVKIVNNLQFGSRIFADPALITEVIQNILSNAIKFTPSNGTVTVFVPESAPGSIAISDTGVGIKPSVIADIFRHEIKTSSKGTAGEPGTGLGLPLSNDIILAHGGSIKIESEEGRGSTFTIALPYIKPQVLVVDDEPTMRYLLRQLLTRAGVDVIEAENGTDALAIMTEFSPHLVITDIMMPEMDGFDFITQMRRQVKYKSTPIIVLTSIAGSEAREKAIGLGADDFIAKTPDMEDFLPRVRRYIV